MVGEGNFMIALEDFFNYGYPESILRSQDSIEGRPGSLYAEDPIPEAGVSESGNQQSAIVGPKTTINNN
jgi:hypothetical protein